jgi:hypothetical protein
VVPPAGDPFDHPALTTLALSDTKPPDLQEKVVYQGVERRYARLCYGSLSSRDIVVVLDRLSETEVHLYVDADRNGIIEAKELLSGHGLTWRTTLDASLVGPGQTKQVPRSVVLQLGRNGRTLRVATCGYLEGKVAIAGRDYTVRRTDGNANGLFADPDDHLWIDLDANGHWDHVEEQYLYAPILVLGGKRYAVRSDELGERLAFEELRGIGTLSLALPSALSQRGADVAATFVSRDGLVVSLLGKDAKATLPVGDYRISTATITLNDSAGQAPWTYAFTDTGRRGEPVWHAIGSDQSVALDPFGKLALEAGLGERKGVYHPGETVEVQPRLHTADGLTIARMFREAARGPQNGQLQTRLVAHDGRTVATVASGFG